VLKAVKERARAERELEAHELAALGPEFADDEALRPKVLQPFFGGSAAPRLDIDIEEDADAFARAQDSFTRAAGFLRVVGEDD
jgi:hypothetical protein